MPSTNRLVDTINWALPFVGFAPLAIGPGNEPAISNANTVLQTIVSPPFRWPWNRKRQTFLTFPGIQDYTISFPSWGYLEVASIQPAAVVTATVLTSNIATYSAVNSFAAGNQVTVTGSSNGSVFNVVNGTIATASPTNFTVAVTSPNISVAVESNCVAASGKPMPMEIKYEALSEAAEQDRPQFIANHLDDGNGNLTFRTLPISDQIYQVAITYQQGPSLFTSLPQPWGIPDYMENIINFGFLFLSMDYWQMPEAARYRTLFVATLLGRAEGLDETDKNLFLGNWMALQAQLQARMSRTTQGIQAQGT